MRHRRFDIYIRRFRSEEARFSMLTREEDVEISALRVRGWTISQIAWHRP